MSQIIFVPNFWFEAALKNEHCESVRMQSLAIKEISDEPQETEILLYPDYLIGCLAREGMGKIEAERKAPNDAAVEFVFTNRVTSESKVIGRLGRGYFRSLLAHFGYRCNREMLYSGHELFSCEFECDGQIRTHRFSFFMCNEPKMGIWMRLYLYGIDGISPVTKS